MYCKHCGKQIAEDSVFCQYCGGSLSTNSQNHIVNQTHSFHQVSQQNKKDHSGHYEQVTPPDTRNKAIRMQWIKSTNLENQANQEELGIRGTTSFVIIFIGLGLGVYYWFGEEFIFTYDQLSPFWGFVVYVLITFTILFIGVKIATLYWEDYNNVIKEARKELSNRIENGIGSPEELERMKKHHIERKLSGLVEEELTPEEFQWHTARYCWGCGKPHTEKPVLFVYYKRRSVTWKDRGVIRRTKICRQGANILVCPHCKAGFRIQTEHSDYIGKTKWNFDKIPIIADFLKADLWAFYRDGV